MRDIIKALALAAAVGTIATAFAQAADSQDKPTIVLVHGAFAESSANDVIGALAVNTETASGNANVTASVDLAAVAPEAGESSVSLSGEFPGSTLADALTTTTLPEGGKISTFGRTGSTISLPPMCPNARRG
ncbi:hypothetical protein ASD52_33340 [Ensifer sp. Root142]|uniref:hypothetical protein n=1 Tax=Ensifer TaxID=106591 RepID=UPI00070CBF95|nr:hypothetical protein [Ensifer canadensis]KQY68477.1 hypothetical protein ASD52_33340 [Ensifer sp. Root142]